MKKVMALLVSLLGGILAASADDPQPLMVQRGACLLDESFSSALDTSKWQVGIGAWTVESGALSGVERPADHHPAVMKTSFKPICGIAQISFLAKGDAKLQIAFNDAGGHNSRVQVSTNSLVMFKNADRKDPRSYTPILDETGAVLAPDTWHTMTLELCGEEMLARVDGKFFVCGSHPGINQEKTDLLLVVSGSAQFDNVKLWSATPNSSWPAEKAKLLASAAGRPAVDRSGNPQEAYMAAEVKVRDRLMKSDEKFKSLVDVRGTAMEALAKAFPVVNRKGPKADAEKKRLASEDANFKQLTKTVQVAQKAERDYLVAQAPEVKKLWEALVAANRAKASPPAAAKK